VAENAILVMHNVKALRQEGVGLDDALGRATLMRSRRIVMTTRAAVCALLPLTLGFGAGAQLQQPLAIVVVGGFSLSRFLLSFGLLVLYRLMKRPSHPPGEQSCDPFVMWCASHPVKSVFDKVRRTNAPDKFEAH
jgi:multidrug efflux pump subunit AcrB